MEQEIDLAEELEEAAKNDDIEKLSTPQIITNDLKSLHERVRN